MDYINHLEFYMSRDTLNTLKKCEDLYLKSAMLVRILFKDKKDKAGNPYIGHLLRVSSKMSTVDGMVAGLLHDVVEDIDDIGFDDLLDFGIPNNIIEALKLVTKEATGKKFTKEEKLKRYNEEIDRIIASGNDLALGLKEADMSDNYNPDRLSQLNPKQIEWFRMKYGENLEKLKLEKEKRKIKC